MIMGLPRILHRARLAKDADTPTADRAWELLFTIGFLHIAFLAGFYGWKGSWTYYSYLPVLGLALFAKLVAPSRTARIVSFWVLAALMLLSHAMLLGTSWDAWNSKSPSGDGPGAAPGLWRYPFQFAAWQSVVQWIGNRRTVIMTNGYLFNLSPTMQMPDAWFPEPGIPTASEIERVRNQVDHADCVVLCNEYGEDANHEHPDLRLWSFKEFEPERREFEVVKKNELFTVLRRIGARESPATTTKTPP
jgi:hypothetical protein